MSVPNQLEQSVARLREASARIATARRGASSPENLREWLAALTDFASALADIQTFNNESVHENGDVGGIGLIPRELRQQFPFVKID